jgi:hypothetical protein
VSDRGADERMDKIQRLGVRQATRVSSREPPPLPDFGRQDGVRRDVEGHPAGFVGTPIFDRASAEVGFYKLGDVLIKAR